MSQPALAAPASLVATGEVGLLADENAQRLCSIFGEAGFSCLTELRELSGSHGADRFDKLYRVGLGTVQSWGPDLLREETRRLETRYPELPSLYAYVYLSLLEVTHAQIEDLQVPPLEEVYHAFMRRLAASPDVDKGLFFFEVPHAHRRATFVDALRGALHDVMRRRAGAAARSYGVVFRGRTPPPTAVAQASASALASAPPRSCAAPSEAGSCVGLGLGLGRVVATPLPVEAATAAKSAPNAVPVKPASVLEAAVRREREATTPAAAAQAFSEIAPSSAATRAVTLPGNVCFFGEEAGGDAEAPAAADDGYVSRG